MLNRPHVCGCESERPAEERTTLGRTLSGGGSSHTRKHAARGWGWKQRRDPVLRPMPDKSGIAVTSGAGAGADTGQGRSPTMLWGSGHRTLPGPAVHWLALSRKQTLVLLETHLDRKPPGVHTDPWDCAALSANKGKTGSPPKPPGEACFNTHSVANVWRANDCFEECASPYWLALGGICAVPLACKQRDTAGSTFMRQDVIKIKS